MSKILLKYSYYSDDTGICKLKGIKKIYICKSKIMDQMRSL